MSVQADVLVRQPLLPLQSDFRVTFYDAARLERYREAVLTVLERTGVRFGSPKALDILQEHGARVDRASGVVRFAPDLVTRALARAPRTFRLGSRDGSCDLDLGNGVHLQHDQRLRHRGHRLARRPAAPADEVGSGRHHARRRLPRLRAVLVAHRGRRRLRRHPHPARAGGRLGQHRQAPAGHGAGRARWRATRWRWPPWWPAGPKSSAAGRP